MNQPPYDPQPPVPSDQPPHEPDAYEAGPRPPATRRVIVDLPGDPPVTVYVLMGLTVLVFVLQLASQQLLQGLDYPAYLGLKANELIQAGQLWRLFTPMLLHGSILHIGSNMYALYAIGLGLERQYGHGRFLALYILSGFAGNVMSFLFTDAPSLGASTAIYGLIGAEIVFLYQNRAILGPLAQRGLRNVMTVVAINLFISLTPGIDLWGHLGGLLGGLLFAWSAGPLLQVSTTYPEITLVDARRGGETLRAVLAVGGLFAMLAAVTMFIRR